MEPIPEVEEGPELVSSLFDKQVLDYRQRELAAAELHVHVPIINYKSLFIRARLWHKKPPADPMGWAGHNPALFLKLFYFFTHGLFPKANCTNGLVSLRLCIRNWLQDTDPIGTLFVHVFFISPTMITSFLEQDIFEPVVNRIPMILAMRMLSIRLNHRTHTPIPGPENGNWIT